VFNVSIYVLKCFSLYQLAILVSSGCSSAVLRASRATVLGVTVAAVALALAPWVARLAGIHDIVAKILITSFSGVSKQRPVQPHLLPS
jgi:hypothetical protein